MKQSGPAVFVHGNPETAAVWEPLLEQLGREDVVLLSPPGFGSALPGSFDPTMASYLDWLIDRLESFRYPVDLVGHDWGGVHALNGAMSRPDLLRSWVSDAAGLFHSDYVWHPLAQTWQTPDAGERMVGRMVGVPLTQRIHNMHDLGITDPTAERLAAGQDQQMGRAIISLYRSARQPVLIRAGQGIAAAAARPGLVISATDDDTTGTEQMRRTVAQQAGADVAVLEELGHWWMVQDPSTSAHTLSQFWSSLT